MVDGPEVQGPNSLKIVVLGSDVPFAKKQDPDCASVLVARAVVESVTSNGRIMNYELIEDLFESALKWLEYK